MGKNQSASNLTNIIKQDASGNISFVSGSTTLMSVSSSGAIATTGNVAGTASYASNAELLDGLDSTVFTLTSSFAAQTASFTAFTASQNILNGTYATTGSNTFAGIQTVNSNLIVTGSITAQTLVVQTITSSVDFVTGSTRFGSILGNTHVFSGSVTMNPGGLFVSSSGNVGIGTTSPSAALNVNGISAGASIDWTNTTATTGRTFRWVSLNAGGFAIEDITASATRMTVTAGGNVGIGTTNPSQTLSVVGNARFEATSGNRYVDIASSGSSIQIGTDGTTQFIYGSGGAFPLVLSTNGEEKMRIASNGLVSINNKITSSTYKLGVSGSAYINGSNGKGIFISDQATYATIVGLNSAISAYNGLELRASGTDYQLYLNTDGRVFINSNAASAYFDGKVNSYGEGTVPGACFKNAGNSQFTCAMWNAATAGDNPWITFVTEASPSVRGGIDYNRAGGVVRYNTSSDANLKNIIGYSDKQKSVDILNSTKIREFSWKEDETNKSQIGVIAQELYETFKGAVSVGSDESLLGTEDYKNWAVDKTAFTFHLIAGWQKHEQIIQELKAEIDELKNR